MKRIALRILALMLVWAIIPSTRAQESKTLDDFKRTLAHRKNTYNFNVRRSASVPPVENFSCGKCSGTAPQTRASGPEMRRSLLSGNFSPRNVILRNFFLTGRTIS